MSDAKLASLRRTLSQLRLERRMSYAALANEIGVSMPAVRDFILANTEPHETTQYAIRSYLKKAEAA